MGFGEIRGSIRHGFGGVTRFSGRDTRRQFWPYAIFLYLASSGLGAVVMAAGMMRLILAMSRVPAHETGSIPEMDALVRNTAIWAGALAAIVIAIAAAAITRRLHDSNMRGYWGLMPIPPLVVGLVVLPKTVGLVAERADRAADNISLLFANNVIYLGLLALLLLLLARRSDEAANRFGPPPPL
jgi:uncharacterized membrane protein YhaH (DUF805 family)